MKRTTKQSSKQEESKTSNKEVTAQETKKATEMQRWQKIGGGRLYINDKVIVPGQIFLAKAADIPKTFRDTVVPEGDARFGSMTMEQTITEAFMDRIPGGRWNVYDAEGNKVNEEPLLVDEAKELLDEIKDSK